MHVMSSRFLPLAGRVNKKQHHHKMTLEATACGSQGSRSVHGMKGLGLPGKNVLVPGYFEQVLQGLPL